MQRLLIGLAVVIAPITASAAVLSPDNAANHVGQTETVCGVVASTHYAPHSRGQPTFLNFDHPYPNEDFTAVIWGEHRSAFPAPEAMQGQKVCVTGAIRLYRGRPEVILRHAG